MDEMGGKGDGKAWGKESYGCRQQHPLGVPNIIYAVFFVFESLRG
jgi:hypothetical protein